MTSASFIQAFDSISESMTANCAYLTELDQRSGDGDLGISMKNGFGAVSAAFKDRDIADLGLLMKTAGSVLNENSPSTLGTILSIGMMGMAKALKGKTDVSMPELSAALDAGIKTISDRANSKRGEKTILDSLCPAADALREAADKESWPDALAAAAESAKRGSDSTKTMKATHGRAAYYGEKSIGLIDGGSVVGWLIFAAIAKQAQI